MSTLSAASPAAAEANLGDLTLWGVDFSSAPSRRKPIVAAKGTMRAGVVKLLGLEPIETLGAFEAWLAQPGPWWAGFDFPFGLPRAFVDSQNLGNDVAAVSREVHARCETRMAFRAWIDAWGASQPAGQRLIHRATDKADPQWSSTSPLQTRYVPVGFMWFEGLQRLLHAGLHLPGLAAGDRQRQGFEAYPGALAQSVLGRRSYKNSEAADRLIARKDLVEALELGKTLVGLRLQISHALRDTLVADASGDRLDAVLCLMQVAWARQHPERACPLDLDPVEGWILTAPHPTAARKA